MCFLGLVWVGTGIDLIFPLGGPMSHMASVCLLGGTADCIQQGEFCMRENGEWYHGLLEPTSSWYLVLHCQASWVLFLGYQGDHLLCRLMGLHSSSGASGALLSCREVVAMVGLVGRYWNMGDSSFCSLFTTLYCLPVSVLMLCLVFSALLGFTAFNSFLGKAPSYVAYLMLFRWICWAYGLGLFH